MSMIKNEHLVWGYADRTDGKPGKVVLIGITDNATKFLQAEEGNALPITPPMGQFLDVSQIIVFRAKDKAALRELLRKAGLSIISEVN
jgi:hypothetical protein